MFNVYASHLNLQHVETGCELICSHLNTPPRSSVLEFWTTYGGLGTDRVRIVLSYRPARLHRLAHPPPPIPNTGGKLLEGISWCLYPTTQEMPRVPSHTGPAHQAWVEWWPCCLSLTSWKGQQPAAEQPLLKVPSQWKSCPPLQISWSWHRLGPGL